MKDSPERKKLFTSKWMKYIVIVALFYIAYWSLIYFVFEQ